MLFAQQEFELNEQDKSGSTLKEHLLSIWRQTGVKPTELDAHELPELYRQHWEDFLELHSARTCNGFGVNPITYLDIDAWARLTGKAVNASDIQAIKVIDHIYLQHVAKQTDKK